MDLGKKSLEKQGYKLEVVAPAQHEEEESEPEQCPWKGKEGWKTKVIQRKSRWSGQYQDKVSEGKKDCHDHPGEPGRVMT